VEAFEETRTLSSSQWVYRIVKEDVLCPFIHAFLEERGWPSWTESEIRRIKWETVRGAKVIPDVVAIRRGSTIIAVEAEPNASSDSINHGVGQTGRFSAFAGILYIAFPAPVPAATKDELLLICPGTGMLEVDAATGTVRERIRPRRQRPKDAKKWKEWKFALKDVKKREQESADRQFLTEKRRSIKTLLSEARWLPGYRALIEDISLDKGNGEVLVKIRDPSQFATSTVSPEHVDSEEFAACCTEIDTQLRAAGVFDTFGPDTKVKLISDVFTNREDCNHIGSVDFCPLCGSRPNQEDEERTDDED
jgi:hypothetical protein